MEEPDHEGRGPVNALSGQATTRRSA
jgi:hypothetical protein